MPALSTCAEPLARLRDARGFLRRSARSAASIVGTERGDLLRLWVDVVADDDPYADPARFRTAAVELAVLSHLHGENPLRDAAMSVARHLWLAEEPCPCGCSGDCEPAEEQMPAAAPDPVDAVLQSPGDKLDPTARRVLERYFDEDLGDVRIHSDAAATAALTAAKAMALAAGNHIVIAPGFAAQPARGLLVHEMLHVLQQRHGRRTTAALAVQHDRVLEREAEDAARAFLGFLSGARRQALPSVTPSDVALAYQPFPAQCLDICPLRVASRFPPAPCLLTNCDRLGFFPPVFARSWCVYLCPGNWEGPEAAWLINTIFGQVGPYYTA